MRIEKDFESNLPHYLNKSLVDFKKADSEKHSALDCFSEDLKASLNSALIDGDITESQFWYLRKEYVD